MRGRMICPHAAALEHEAQTSAPPMAFQRARSKEQEAGQSDGLARGERAQQGDQWQTAVP